MFDDRNVWLDVAVCVFGISSWISINGLWIELPVLVAALPESWSLASYLSIICQLANLGPITYSLLLWKWPKMRKDIAIGLLLALGTVSTLMLALFWDVTSYIGGEEHSTCLFVFTFFMAFVDCTSSVLYMPFMAVFRQIYLNSYLIGEGLSGLVPSLFALIQGVGGNPECRNVSYPNGTFDIVAYQEEPRFSADVFFYVLTGMMVCSSAAFLSLNIVPAFKLERAIDNGKDNNNKEEKSMEDSLTSIDLKAVRPTKYYSFLGIIFVVCFFANGFFPSIQTYSCLPYGNLVYHLCVTLGAIANPAAAFSANFIKTKKFSTIVTLTAVSLVLAGYILATALYSPEPLGGLTVGGTFAVIVWVLWGYLVTFVRVSIAGYCRQRSEMSLFWCGAYTQLGSACGAVLSFSLVNYTSMFQQYYVIC